MKKVLSFLNRILPHVTLILSVMLLVFYVIDLCNPSMAFLDNSVTKALLATDAVLTCVLSVTTVLCKENKISLWL